MAGRAQTGGGSKRAPAEPIVVAVLIDEGLRYACRRITGALGPSYRVEIARHPDAFSRVLTQAWVGIVSARGQASFTATELVGQTAKGKPLLFIDFDRREQAGIERRARNGWEIILPEHEIERCLPFEVARAVALDLRRSLRVEVLSRPGMQSKKCLFRGLTGAFSRSKVIQRVKGLANEGECKPRTVERDWRELFGPAAPSLKTLLVAIVIIDLLLTWLDHPDKEIKAFAREKFDLMPATTRRYTRLWADINGAFRVSHIPDIVSRIRKEILGTLLQP